MCRRCAVQWNAGLGLERPPIASRAVRVLRMRPAVFNDVHGIRSRTKAINVELSHARPIPPPRFLTLGPNGLHHTANGAVQRCRCTPVCGDACFGLTMHGMGITGPPDAVNAMARFLTLAANGVVQWCRCTSVYGTLIVSVRVTVGHGMPVTGVKG